MKWKIFLILISFLILIIAFSRPDYFDGIRIFGIFGREKNIVKEADNLAVQNLRLKTELDLLKNAREQLGENSEDGLAAAVYSRYPFNFKNELLFQVGEDNGIKGGEAVLWRGILIGRIKSVSKKFSSAQTFFDSNVEIAVRIGEKGTNAVLKGGVSPKLTLISKDAEIKTGDSVYSASADFSYGLPIGKVSEVTISDGQLFKEASLDFPYDINQITFVSIRI